MTVFSVLILAAVAFGFAEIGAALAKNKWAERMAWWQVAACVVALVAAGELLARQVGFGPAIFAAAALGGLLAGLVDGWKVAAACVATAGALLWLRLGVGVGLGLLIVSAAWVPGAIVRWVLGWKTWSAGRGGVMVALVGLIVVVAYLGGGSLKMPSESNRPAEASGLNQTKISALKDAGAGEKSQECACGSGSPECIGPKGGHYCLKPDGSKKYL